MYHWWFVIDKGSIEYMFDKGAYYLRSMMHINIYIIYLISLFGVRPRASYQCGVLIKQEAPRRSPAPPQLPPFDGEELYSELPSDI